MEVRKAVVTAAGWGTRFLPATKAQPKEMLPLVDKPLIQYSVEEAVASGIEEIIIVTARGKRAIADHFDRSLELEHLLGRKGEGQLLERVRAISELASVCYIRQKEQLGLGHAVLITRDLIGDHPFAVLLPDDVIEAPVPALRQMLEVHRRYRASVIALERVAPEDAPNYGIVEVQKIEERVYQVLGLVEKPEPEESPSNLGIVGRYILTPQIFEALEVTTAGRGAEIQLTDGLRRLLEKQPIYGYEFQGLRHDAGTPLGWLKASVGLAVKCPDIGPEFARFLKDFVRSKLGGEG